MILKQLHIKILQELALMIQPIHYLLKDKDYRKYFFLTLGWNLDDLNGIPFGKLDSSIDDISKKIDLFQTAFEEATDIEATAFFDLIHQYGVIFLELKKLKNAIDDFGDDIDKDEIQKDVIGFLISKYIYDSHPILFNTFRIYNVIEYKSHDKTIFSKEGKAIKFPYLFPIFKKENLKNLFQSPKKFFEETYGLSGSWETQEQVKAITDTLFPLISQLVHSLNGQSLYGIKPEYGISFGEVGDKIISNYLYLYWKLNSNASVGTTLALSPKEMGDLGWVIMPSAVIGTTKEFGDWTLNTNITADFGMVTIKDGKVKTSNPDARFELGLSRKSDPKIGDEEKWVIGNRDKTHILIDWHEEKVGLQTSNGKLNMEATLGLNNITLELDPNDTNSFIAKLMNHSKIKGDFDLLIGWSNLDGFFLGGGAQMDMVTSVNKDYGFLLIRDIRTQLIIFENYQKIRGRVGLSFIAKTGILTAYVEGLGPSLLTEVNNNNINASGFNIATPETIGIEINSSTVNGAGLISLRKDLHQYDGMLELEFCDVEVAGFAIVDTRLPDGEKGFAMLVSLNVEFAQPIMLGLGFTLNGVGGLIAINRTINSTQLRNKLATGLYDNILFPSQPFKNAFGILSDLRDVFPAKENHDIVAPFVKIGWGNFVFGELGILVEKPSRGRVLIIGNLKIAFPSEEKDWIDLKMDVLGDFNNGEDYILIQAQLYDSKFVGFPIYGGSAFMLDWGERPAFLLSVGGYHPRYKKPNRFPEIPRAGMAIRFGKYVTLTCEFYYAITSNSFQTGASVSLAVRKGKLGIDGYFMYDALLQINPFHFDVSIGLGVALRWGSKKLAGVGLRFQFSGPKPWNVNGYAKIRILFIKIKVRFNYTWGDSVQPPREFIASDILLNQLKTALEKRQSWTAQLPSNFKVPERLRSIDETQSEKLVVVHPSGILEFSQNVLPLNQSIEKFGKSYVEGKPTYRIESLKIGNEETSILIEKNSIALRAYFSRGQYEALPEATQLSTKDFELMDTGYRFEGLHDVIFSDQMETVSSAYENIILRNDLTRIPQDEVTTIEQRDWITSRNTNRSAKKKTWNEALENFDSFNASPNFRDSDYYLVDKNDFTRVKNESGISPKVFDTQSEANAYLNILPKEKQVQLQIMSVEEYELQLELI